MDLSDLAVAIALTVVFAIPLMVTMWALLDAAQRPQWAWALSEHRQLVWIAIIMFSALTVAGGLLVGAWYLVHIRPQVRAAEEGRIDT